MQTTAEYTCAFCGEPNLTFIDLSAGGQQSYIEDCQVCCRPNVLYVRIDEETLDIEIDSDYEVRKRLTVRTIAQKIIE
jgi:hypothetical protein